MTRSMDPSEIKDTLTKLLTYTKASGISLRDLARVVYDGIEMDKYEPETFDQYFSRCRFGVKIPNGALVFVADEDKPEIWWADIYAPKTFVSRAKLFLIGFVVAQLGCEILACDIHTNHKQKRWCEFMKMQQIDEMTYALEVK